MKYKTPTLCGARALLVRKVCNGYAAFIHHAVLGVKLWCLRWWHIITPLEVRHG